MPAGKRYDNETLDKLKAELGKVKPKPVGLTVTESVEYLAVEIRALVNEKRYTAGDVVALLRDKGLTGHEKTMMAAVRKVVAESAGGAK